MEKKNTYNFYLVIEVPDHVYVFYAYRLYFADKDIYRVIQEESALLWEMIVWVILRKKVHTNMGPILNGYGVMGIF